MITQRPRSCKGPECIYIPHKEHERRGVNAVKRLMRDLAVLLAVTLLALGLDRLGAYSAMAAMLETTAAAEAAEEESPSLWPGESAAYLPPAPTLSPAPEAAEPEEIVSALSRGDLRSASSLAVDQLSLLREGWSYSVPAEGPQVLIFHTHSCEAYTPQGADDYEPSGEFRTLDESQSVIAVGDALAAALEARGFQVLHDRSLYDYPAYNGAYDRSGAAVRQLLEQNPGVRVVIDLHRDSLGGRRTEYLLPDGTVSAQVMLLLTTGENGLYHPSWRENLKLGLELQNRMELDYPGLARPLYLSPARYNQHLSPGALLLEVGTDANTLSEAKQAILLFADCLGKVLETHKEN